VSQRHRVAITGVGVVCPLGDSAHPVMDAMLAGRSGVGPLDAFPTPGFEVRAAAQVRGFELGRYLDDRTNDFMAGKEDRKTELGLAACELAVRDAHGEAPPDRVPPAGRGLFLATGLGSNVVSETEQDFLPHIDGVGAFDYAAAGRRVDRVDSPFRWRHLSDLAVHLVAARHRIHGPVVTNYSACAAGAISVGQAFREIRAGRLEWALAGGFESMIHPFGVLSFQLLGALSESDRPLAEISRPFDRDRDGFVIGEGAAAFVLESMERVGDRPVYGELAGLGTSVDAYRVTAPSPDGSGAALCMRRALEDARLPATAVDYINAHGTSTLLNDVAETLAIKQVFGPRGSAPPVSSTKSMVGHAVAAAGNVELLAVLAALRDQALPPTINLDHPDPACDLDYVPREAREAPVRVALSNSFGFGGQNACLAVSRAGEAP
jgi:3-oxoacyl-[acyl-carrier-protein] synthase II